MRDQRQKLRVAPLLGYVSNHVLRSRTFVQANSARYPSVWSRSLGSSVHSPGFATLNAYCAAGPPPGAESVEL